MGASFSRRSLFEGLFGKKDEVNMLMLGLDATGKTTILHKLNLGEVKTTIPTIGFNVETLEYSRSQSVVSFTVWDVGGRDKIRPLWRHYYKMCNCLIYVVDSNDRDRIEDAREELFKVLQEDEFKDAPVLVFANKQDLPNAMKVPEVTEKMHLHSLRSQRWFIQGSCALSRTGLFEGLDWLSAEVAREGRGEAAAPAGLAPDPKLAAAAAATASPDGADGMDGAETASTAATEDGAAEEVHVVG